MNRPAEGGSRTVQAEGDAHAAAETGETVDLDNFMIEEDFTRPASTTRTRRHSAEVTRARLDAALARWSDQFTRQELDMVAVISARLGRIADPEPSRAT